jgi:acetyl-CoA carboxylase carboxyl transferase beta subunit
MKQTGNTPKRSFKERYDLIRHPDRIRSSDIIEGVFDDLSFLDCPDPSLVIARGSVDGIECLIIGQEKKRAGKESKATGMVNSKGHSYALDMLDKAEEENLPVVTFVDTFGGDTSMDSELGGQSFLISDCITKFCSIETPTVSIVIGEGGSGGALAFQVTDKSYMLENALYSVIAPESCSRIIFHKRLTAGEPMEDTVKDSLDLLKPGAENIKFIGMIDEILPEPEKGAHTDYEFTIKTIKSALQKTIKEWGLQGSIKGRFLAKSTLNKIVKKRRERVLNYGEFEKGRDRLFKRNTKAVAHDNVKKIDVERETFYNHILIKASLEERGITDTEIYECEMEWLPELKKFRVAGGCGFVSHNDYVDNFYACPKCGKGEYLGIEEQIEKICDKGTFKEIELALTTRKLIGKERYYYGKYKERLEKLENKSFSNEALVAGTAEMNGRKVVVAITDLGFFGGSFGAAFGEKFKRTIDYARKKEYPFISICSSGGARMNEGTMSLAQMAKMNMALLDLKRKGILYMSVIAEPTTGGAYASYVTQGDIMIGEKGSLVEFAGPRVVTGAGFHVEKDIVCTDNLYKTRKLQHLVHRRDLKNVLSYYVDLYYDMKYSDQRKHFGRIRDFRKKEHAYLNGCMQEHPTEIEQEPARVVSKE